MPESRMSRLSNQYHDWARNHPTAAGDFRTAIEDLLNDAGIIFDRVSTRVKTWPSLKAKAKKRRENGDFVYPQPWQEIHDVMGVRVTLFHSTAIPEAETTAFRVDASDGVLLWLSAFLVAIIPCACLGVAILTWWERR